MMTTLLVEMGEVGIVELIIWSEGLLHWVIVGDVTGLSAESLALW